MAAVLTQVCHISDYEGNGCGTWGSRKATGSPSGLKKRNSSSLLTKKRDLNNCCREIRHLCKHEGKGRSERWKVPAILKNYYPTILKLCYDKDRNIQIIRAPAVSRF